MIAVTHWICRHAVVRHIHRLHSKQIVVAKCKKLFLCVNVLVWENWCSGCVCCYFSAAGGYWLSDRRTRSQSGTQRSGLIDGTVISACVRVCMCVDDNERHTTLIGTKRSARYVWTFWWAITMLVMMSELCCRRRDASSWAWRRRGGYDCWMGDNKTRDERRDLIFHSTFYSLWLSWTSSCLNVGPLPLVLPLGRVVSLN